MDRNTPKLLLCLYAQKNRPYWAVLRRCFNYTIQCSFTNEMSVKERPEYRSILTINACLKSSAIYKHVTTHPMNSTACAVRICCLGTQTQHLIPIGLKWIEMPKIRQPCINSPSNSSADTTETASAKHRSSFIVPIDTTRLTLTAQGLASFPTRPTHPLDEL